MPSACNFKFEISDLRPGDPGDRCSANSGIPSIRHGMDRTSPAEPRAIYRNVKLWRRSALESLGNVVGNRNGGALELVAQAVLAPKGNGLRECVNLLSELDRRLPDRELLEA